MSGLTRIASTITLLMLPAVMNAQPGMGSVSRVRYGVLLGAAVSTVSEAKKAIGAELTAAVDTRRRKGFDGGIYVNIPLAGMLSLQPEAHYAQKGVTISTPVSGAAQDFEFAFKADYLEVPVLLRVDLGSRTSSIHPLLVGGASVAMRLTCKTVTSTGGASASVKCDESGTDGEKVSKKDMSMVGGAGLAMSAGGRSLALQFRYTQGLSNVLPDEPNGAKARNGAYSVLLGIGF